jgi:sulfofructose kinase
VGSPLVVAAGQVATDFLGAGARRPNFDDDNILSEVSVQVGGSGAVAAIAAAFLGCQTRFCGKVAGDFLGRFIAAGLDGAGVDTEFLVQSSGRLTPFTFTAIGRADSTRCRFVTYGDVEPLRPEDIDVDRALRDASALLLDGTQPEVQCALAEAARARGVRIILDASVLKEGLGEVIALADVLISSERLASEIAPRGELQDSLVELQRLGPRSAIITMGEAGSIGLHEDQLVEQRAYKVDAVDATGAGSVYHGAFAAALVTDEPFARCMAFASIAAGLSCQRLGGLGGIPRRGDVLVHLKP